MKCAVDVVVSTMLVWLSLLMMVVTVVTADDSSTRISTSTTNQPSLMVTYHQQYERYLNQIPILRSSHDQTIRHLVSSSLVMTQQLQQLQPPQQHQQRFLQDSTTSNTTNTTANDTTAQPPPPQICNDTGSVNFSDDEFNMILFGRDMTLENFDSICICEEENNSNEIESDILALEFSDVDAFVVGFNTLIGQLETSTNYSCYNLCQSCFLSSFDDDDTIAQQRQQQQQQVCAFFSITESSSLQNKMGNFTFEDIATNSVSSEDLLNLVETAHFYSENCIQYTNFAYSNSEVCFIIDFQGVPNNNETMYCNITYNDVLCNSCTITQISINTTGSSSDDDDCIVADCTNVDSIYGTMIDVCTNTGLTGPFQYFALKDIANSTTFTAGTCNDGDVDVVAPVPTPIPVDGPITPTTSIATTVPTNAPMVITGPTTTMVNSINTTTNVTNAPVKSPTLLVPTPVRVATDNVPISDSCTIFPSLSVIGLLVVVTTTISSMMILGTFN